MRMEKHDPDDPVAMYIREASNVKPLTKEEEAKLFQELGRLDHWGDLDQQREKVARRLIESQLMLVVNIAQRHSASAVPMLELIQEGNIGLMMLSRASREGRSETLLPMPPLASRTQLRQLGQIE